MLRIMQKTIPLSLAGIAAALLATPALAGTTNMRPSGEPTYTVPAYASTLHLYGVALPKDADTRRAYQQDRDALQDKYAALEAANGGQLTVAQLRAMRADIADLKATYNIR